MYLYRGKEIGSREKLAETCLSIIQDGSVGMLYDIIPHIRILRAPVFFEPLIALLHDGSNEQKAVAAHALGSLGDEAGIGHLKAAYRTAAARQAEGGKLVQAAVIAALGEIPCDHSVRILLEIQAAPELNEAFLRQRPKLVITALGQLAQQSVDAALTTLIDLLGSEDPEVTSQTLTELSLAYWHRPNELPEDLARRILGIAETSASRDLALSARAALSSLAQLGSKGAIRCVQALNHRKP